MIAGAGLAAALMLTQLMRAMLHAVSAIGSGELRGRHRAGALRRRFCALAAGPARMTRRPHVMEALRQE